jgi:asparagine synthase (glutamine-hydrolysing)
MCGIVGILYHDPQRKCLEEMLVKMRDLMVHRGPDDAGIYLDGSLGLGQRRLSIIGLTTGHQPMSNEDNSLWIIFNGEIYNYRTLKQTLLGRGHVFKSESDTEVILHLYEDMGEDCVHKLNGMFAFAIWDNRKRCLFLARDRMGIKPLYYAPTPKAFLFSSEIKSLFASDCISPECNDEAVPEYFLFRNVAGERTLFKGVHALLPGHSMKVSNGEVETRQYWSPFPEEINTRISFEQAREELSCLLHDSIKIRMMSEVPLGTFCSGGIDSSLVTAIAARQVSHPINTFSVGFHEAEYDETKYAQLVSARYHTNHHEIKLDSREFADLLPKMIWQNDEPLNFANSVQIYAISKLAKEHVTVVLTGEGADELFAGYPRYQIPQLVATLQKFPQFFIPLLKLAAKVTNDHRIEKLLKFSTSSIDDTILLNNASVDREYLINILNINDTANIPYRLESLNKAKSLPEPVSQLSLLDQLTYLVSILYRQDKMSMAASVEARVPFLDYRIVEFANSLPIHFKLKNGKRKLIIREIAQPLLPREIITRKKSGFGVPLSDWFKSDKGIGGVLKDISVEKWNNSIHIDKSFLNKILIEHNAKKQDHSELLWSVVNYSIWYKTFFD